MFRKPLFWLIPLFLLLVAVGTVGSYLAVLVGPVFACVVSAIAILAGVLLLVVAVRKIVVPAIDAIGRGHESR